MKQVKRLHIVYMLFTCLLAPGIWSASLTWTAPGDDGNVGTATEYDLRASETPVTALEWDLATPIEGEPVPSVAGTQEAYYYYLALKTVDEAGNWSGLSNVVVVPYDSGVFNEDRADFNDSGQLDISDLMILIDYMFITEPR